MDVVIRSYPNTSFYIGEGRKRWVYGNFCIYCNRVTFHEKSDGQLKSVILNFNDIVKIQKAITTIIYGAIVMTLNSGKTFWFSSFQDRESVFTLLCHFQKNLLFESGSTRKPISDSQRTEMGTKLLDIANSSLSTLSNTAVMLNNQGEKIDNSSAMMMNIHNDLDIADHLTSGLEAWVGRWNLPKEYKMVNPIIIKDNDVPQVFDFDVLYTKIEMGKVNQQLEGVIQISKNGLSILNLKQKTLLHFDWSNVSKIRIISPWEMVVIQYRIGKSDISLSVVSSLLINILHKVQCFCQNRMDYETDKLFPMDVGSSTSTSPTQPSLLDRRLEQKRSRKWLQPDFKNDVITDSPGQISHASVGPGSSKGNTNWAQINHEQVLKEKPIITNEEVDELSSTLRNLKSMMLAVGEETDIQNEKLDKVTESVDGANIKLVDVNKRINKLM